ncbi:MAG: hypothetical protein EOO61_02335 [Hymenobacter sp.]|nr:MAG: hypothetical protein EOO61_02335 [Hymenobacter sp.]
MTDFRSKSEEFVSKFLDYIYKYDIKDNFNNQTQKMERSAGVEKLIAQAQAVYPRADNGQVENSKLAVEQMEEAIEKSSNVLDLREEFARKIAANGSARGLLEKVLSGDEAAKLEAIEFIKAERGEKEFREPVS